MHKHNNENKTWINKLKSEHYFKLLFINLINKSSINKVNLKLMLFCHTRYIPKPFLKATSESK